MRSLSAHHPTADDVEQSFYEAMQTAQLEALMLCWAAHHASPGPAQPVVITPCPHLH